MWHLNPPQSITPPPPVSAPGCTVIRVQDAPTDYSSSRLNARQQFYIQRRPGVTYARARCLNPLPPTGRGGGVTLGRVKPHPALFCNFPGACGFTTQSKTCTQIKTPPSLSNGILPRMYSFLWFSIDSLFPATQIKTQPLISGSPGWPGASVPPSLKLPPS